MRKLTNEELAEPNVYLLVGLGAVLAPEVSETLKYFHGVVYKNGILYNLPAYRFRELVRLQEEFEGKEVNGDDHNG